MTDYFHEHTLRERLRELEAVDRRLEHRGWFRRGAPPPRERGWRYWAGGTLIRLGCRLQGGEIERPLRAAGKR